jgi:uncharacterized metal-binding protein YceD (DUF177 family)
VPIQVTDIPDGGRRFEIAADVQTRDAVAKVAGVLALPRLEAVLDLAPLDNGGVRVTGMVSASAEQICVVTLDPMTSRIEERIDLVFVPPGATVTERDIAMLGADNEGDPPETLEDGVIDLGAVATEFLVLGINPYPRKPGVSFEGSGADHVRASPFAALAALKKAPGAKPR